MIYGCDESTIRNAAKKYAEQLGPHYFMLTNVGEDYTYSHSSVSYTHLDVYKRQGQKVGPSTVLGREGATGNASGSHLHLEIHRGNYQYPPKSSSPAKCSWLLDPAAALGIENKAGQVKDCLLYTSRCV